MSILKKPGKGSGNGVLGHPDCGAWGTTYPALWEFVSLAAWEDSSVRATGTLMVLVDQGQLKLWLHDRDSNLSAFVSGSSPDEAFTRAETGLVACSLEWRSDRSSGVKKR